MSSHHEPRAPWIDRWWLPLLILLGLIFTLCIALYRPQHEWSSLRPANAIPAVVSPISTV